MQIFKIILTALIFLGSFSHLIAASSFKDYVVSSEVNVFDQNFVRAKAETLEKLEIILLDKGAREVVTSTIFEENKKKITSYLSRSRNIYIQSLKILEEINNQTTFAMQVKGKVNLSEIQKSLKHINIPLKNAPEIQASLAILQQNTVLIKQIKKKLAAYKITFNKIIQFGRTTENKELDLQTIKNLFDQSQDNLLFLIDKIQIQASSFIRLQIFRRSDLNTIGNYRIKISDENLNSEIQDESIIAKFINRLNLNFINLNDFYKNQVNYFRVKIKGNTLPKSRDRVEKQFFKNALVENFSLSKLSNDHLEYLVVINTSFSRFLKEMQKREHEDLKILEYSNSEVTILSKVSNELQSVPAIPWVEDEQILSHLETLFPNVDEFETWIPVFEESESNSQSTVNRIDTNLPFIGKLYNRSDEDLYSFHVAATPRIKIYWTRMNKSRLAPIIKVYDQKLNLLSQFRVLKNIVKQKFTYQFTSKYSGKLFIKILDQYGFIPGEIGGFQNYPYIMKVQTK